MLCSWDILPYDRIPAFLDCPVRRVLNLKLDIIVKTVAFHRYDNLCALAYGLS